MGIDSRPSFYARLTVAPCLDLAEKWVDQRGLALCELRVTGDVTGSRLDWWWKTPSPSERICGVFAVQRTQIYICGRTLGLRPMHLTCCQVVHESLEVGQKRSLPRPRREPQHTTGSIDLRRLGFRNRIESHSVGYCVERKVTALTWRLLWLSVMC